MLNHEDLVLGEQIGRVSCMPLFSVHHFRWHPHASSPHPGPFSSGAIPMSCKIPPKERVTSLRIRMGFQFKGKIWGFSVSLFPVSVAFLPIPCTPPWLPTQGVDACGAWLSSLGVGTVKGGWGQDEGQPLGVRKRTLVWGQLVGAWRPFRGTSVKCSVDA